MSANGESPLPVSVQIGNWPAKERDVCKTTLKTWVVDPAGLASGKSVQICDYEPNRVRMTVRPIDSAVSITSESPVLSPETANTASFAPQGLYMPVNLTGQPEIFLGPDAFWVNSIAAVTRVAVKKEYQ